MNSSKLSTPRSFLMSIMWYNFAGWLLSLSLTFITLFQDHIFISTYIWELLNLSMEIMAPTSTLHNENLPELPLNTFLKLNHRIWEKLVTDSLHPCPRFFESDKKGLNTYNHKIKKHFLERMWNKKGNIYNYFYLTLHKFNCDLLFYFSILSLLWRVILETEGSIQQKCKRALFLYKKYWRTPLTWATFMFIAYLHCFW